MKRADIRGQTWAWVGLVALMLLFVVVSQRLFAERYATGDVYPDYSSYGSDAKGVRALYRALDASDVEVARSVQPLARMVDGFDGEGVSTAVLLTGWTGRGDQATIAALDDLARGGVRVVVAVATEAWVASEPAEDAEGDDDASESEDVAGSSEENGASGEDEATGEDEAAGESEAPEEADASEDSTLLDVLEEFVVVSAFGRWGAQLRESEREEPWLAHGTDGEQQVPWPSALYFELASDAWRPLYATVDGPVVVERRLGAGSLVLLTSNQLLTNEALAEQRYLALVGQLLAGSERVIFEETHLGIVRSPGVVALARRYRLHGVGLALALMMALAVWRGASNLMPAMERLAPSAVEAPSGREGLVALLRRGIAERDVLRVCVEQWSAGDRREPIDPAMLEVSRQPDTIEGYRRLSRLVQRTRRSR